MLGETHTILGDNSVASQPRLHTCAASFVLFSERVSSQVFPPYVESTRSYAWLWCYRKLSLTIVGSKIAWNPWFWKVVSYHLAIRKWGSVFSHHGQSSVIRFLWWCENWRVLSKTCYRRWQKLRYVVVRYNQCNGLFALVNTQAIPWNTTSGDAFIFLYGYASQTHEECTWML